MNLVQINERLKDLPLQAVQQYANGMNPEVPPYLALSELQRRQAQQQQMSNAQGQGPMPSVKEQIEQKAGLLALQQAQMQQQQSQMMQPRPGPVPAGIPQAEPQPQAMYGGGLARIPVRDDMYQFAGGGIIAFQSGGGTDVQRILKKHPRERTPEENAILERAGIKLQRQQIPQDSAISRANLALEGVGPGIREYITEGASRLSDEELARMPDVGGAGNERILRSLGLGRSLPPSPPPAPAAQQPAAIGAVPSEARLSAGIPALVAGAQPPAPAAPPAAARPPAAAPAPAPQVPQQPTTSPLMQEALAAAREKPVAPTPESIKEGIAALAPQAMTEEAMQKRAAEQRARAEQKRAAFERTRPSGLDELIRVFGQAGQYKGLSGIGPAYTAMQQQKRAEELAMEKRQNELLTAIEGREAKEAGDLFGTRTSAMEKAQQSYQNRLAANTKALADIAGVDQRRIDEALDRMSRMEVAKLQAATANRPTEAERIEANYLRLKTQGKEKEANEYLDRMARIKGGGAMGVGGERNAIMARRQEIAELQSMVKNESGAFSPEQQTWAANRIAQLAKQNAQESGGGSGTMPPPPPGFKLN